MGEWEGSLGNHHLADPLTAEFFALQRLASPESAPDGGDGDYDLFSSGYRRGHNPESNDSSVPEMPRQSLVSEETRNTRRVWKLSLSFFRAKLIEHFDILWRQHKIEWPLRDRAEKSRDWEENRDVQGASRTLTANK